MKTTLTFLLVQIPVFLFGQVSKDSDLFKSLKKHDSIFFEKSFNQCDLKYTEEATHPELIFYHDKSGIQDKAKFLENVQKNLCSNKERKPIRKIQIESLEVYPLYDNEKLYGAIQNGVHEFYIREKGKEDLFTGKAKFTHVYLLQNNQWILKEVLSYDH